MFRKGRSNKAVLLTFLLAIALATAGCEGSTAESEPLTPPPYNASGTLDTSFGGTGIVAADYSPSAPSDDRGFGLAILPSGSILVAGYIMTAGPDTDTTIWRFNSAGVLDISFNGSGILALDIPSGTSQDQQAHAIALQPDGNIAAAGQAQPGADLSSAVWRVYSNGAGLDTGFNTTGFNDAVPPGSTGDDVANAIAVDSQGRIVVAGYSVQGANGFDMAVWRFLPNGTLDTTFNGDGFYVTGTTAAEMGRALVIDGSDNIYVAGSSGGDISVWKLLGTTGNLDPSFNATGQYIYASAAGNDEAQAVTLDSSGRTVVAGFINNGADNDAFLLRLTPAGAPDASFGTSGIATFAALAGGTAGEDAFAALKIDAQGRIVAAGWSLGAGANGMDMALVRVTASGALDTSFAGDGIVTSHGAAGGTGDDFGTALAIDNQGRIVVTGYSVNGTGNFDMALWRYQ